MILGKTPRQPIILNINKYRDKKSRKVVLLVLTIDNRLTFKDHDKILMNCFCGMVDRRKAFSIISGRHHCQRSSLS